MHLLDLPPEIFQNIIHELVCSVGVANAWELRSTCGMMTQVLAAFSANDRRSAILESDPQ